MKKATELPDMANWSDKKIATWLETHAATEILEKTILDQRVREHAKMQTEKHISLRIEPVCIEQAKSVGARKGFGDQTILCSLIIGSATLKWVRRQNILNPDYSRPGRPTGSPLQGYE